jgi:hypothetical protein
VPAFDAPGADPPLSVDPPADPSVDAEARRESVV